MKKINITKKDYRKKVKIFDKGLRGFLIAFILRYCIEEYFDVENNYIYAKDYYCMEDMEELVHLCTNVTPYEFRSMGIDEQNKLFSLIKMKILCEVSIKYNKKIVKKNKLKRK